MHYFRDLRYSRRFGQAIFDSNQGSWDPLTAYLDFQSTSVVQFQIRSVSNAASEHCMICKPGMAMQKTALQPECWSW